MDSLEHIKTTLSNALPQLRQRYPITYLALFGSVVRDDFDARTSDVDILLDFDGEMGWEFFDLQDELQELLGHRVDLVCKRALKPRYLQLIQNDVVDVASAA
ncbi:MAG: nucleotidyltransferase [Bacteroidetes bacterium]|nr:MAG: nucleotidyltransferase [Bacteroidota bacterium]